MSWLQTGAKCGSVKLVNGPQPSPHDICISADQTCKNKKKMNDDRHMVIKVTRPKVWSAHVLLQLHITD